MSTTQAVSVALVGDVMLQTGLEELLGGRHHRACRCGRLDQPDHVVASIAERITLVTSAGRVIGVRWPALTLEM